jgi:integrase/recombinase XerD
MLRSAEAFINECQERDYAESTIQAHTRSLESLSTWSENQNLSVEDCGPERIREFIEWIKRDHSTSYGKIRSETFRSLEKYFKYLVEEEEADRNPCEEVDIVDCIILDDASRYLKRIRATKAEGTVQNRELGLIQFTEWFENQQESTLEEFTPLRLEDYAVHLSRKGYGDTTIIDKFAAVSTLYTFLHEKEESIEHNPTEDVNLDEASIVDYQNPTKQRDSVAGDTIYVTKEQKEAMKDNCPGPKLRNELLIELLWQTGLRRREAADITIDNIDRDKREIQIRGKNDKSRNVFFQPSLDTLLNIWLEGGYRNSYNSAETSNHLFVSERSGRLNPHQINQIIVKSAKNAGIQSKMYTDGNGQNRHKISAHNLRHGFAVQALKNGMDIKTLADIMGHDSLDTTKEYLDLITDDLRERYRKYGPGGTAE